MVVLLVGSKIDCRLTDPNLDYAWLRIAKLQASQAQHVLQVQLRMSAWDKNLKPSHYGDCLLPTTGMVKNLVTFWGVLSSTLAVLVWEVWSKESLALRTLTCLSCLSNSASEISGCCFFLDIIMPPCSAVCLSVATAPSLVPLESTGGLWGYSYRDICMLWLIICSQEGIFYFYIPWNVFGDLLQRSYNLDNIDSNFYFIDNSNHLKDLIFLILWNWHCPSPRLRQWFSQFIRPKHF